MKGKLSTREQSIIDLAQQGYTDEMIAVALSIKTGTVNSYWVRIRGKMGHLSRTELVARHVQKAADEAHDLQREESDSEAAKVTAEHKRLMELAESEIHQLRQRVSDLEALRAEEA